jgi:hypothetical protein
MKCVVVDIMKIKDEEEHQQNNKNKKKKNLLDTNFRLLCR